MLKDIRSEDWKGINTYAGSHLKELRKNHTSQSKMLMR
jgi:hypothetical protein